MVPFAKGRVDEKLAPECEQDSQRWQSLSLRRTLFAYLRVNEIEE
jgi:hypothetical protein